MPVSLFDEILLPINIKAPEGFCLRALRDNDFGYLELLKQLTSVGHVTKNDFEQRFLSMKKANSYYVVVLEHIQTAKIVGAATLVIEFKFIHGAGSRGRVEDVVVDESMRGQKLGVLLNRVLVDMAKTIGVYKLSLECKTELKPFYNKFGYSENLHFMVQRFDEPQSVLLD
uniref:glucosamine-phosphate N-acetyltransferase n=1 Tax=Caenorhabditis japonica TaxID=281687 RepID=A0A8R1HY13_CAEJA